MNKKLFRIVSLITCLIVTMGFVSKPVAANRTARRDWDVNVGAGKAPLSKVSKREASIALTLDERVSGVFGLYQMVVHLSRNGFHTSGPFHRKDVSSVSNASDVIILDDGFKEWSLGYGADMETLAFEGESPQSLQSVIFLPLVVEKWQPPQTVDMPGLQFALPADWSPSVSAGVPITATTGIAGRETRRFVSPDGRYTLNVTVDWFGSQTEQDTFGAFAMLPDNRYEETVYRLNTGELAQVMHVITVTHDGSILLARAAFRSGRGSYVISLHGDTHTEQVQTTFREVLDTVRPRPETLEASTVLNNEGDRAAARILAPSAVRAVPYDRNAAVQYANTYVPLFDNSDDCYLWWNGTTLRCDYLEGYWGVDGAHFVNRAAAAGGLPIPGLWDGVALRSHELRSWLLNNGGQEIGNPNDLLPGDVIFFGTAGGCGGRTWGWEGVVIDQNCPGGGPRLHLHSLVTGDPPETSYGEFVCYSQVTRNNCGWTDTYSFVHIDSSQDQPAPLIATSLLLGPSTPFENQDVRATFRVCNYGGADFDTDNLYVRNTSPAANFPSVDPPPLASGNPGDCYNYDQTDNPYSTSGWYTIRAGYQEGGQFYQLDTVAGQINEQTIYVASPDEIQLVGEMDIAPTEVLMGNGVSVRFTARNTAPTEVVDRFRVRAYDETYPDPGSLVAEFTVTGDVTLASGAEYTYDHAHVFDTPGIYWIVGEHWAGGAWVPVYGDTRKSLRVLYPPPSKPQLAKGMPPYIALAGEPVNTGTGNFIHEHTDLVIPSPGIPFDVTRYYNHIDADQITGPFGHGATWSLGWHVDWREDKTAVLTYPDGRETYLYGELNADDPFDLSGEYVGQMAETQSLVRAEDGTAVLEGNDRLVYEFDAAGELIRVRDGAGNGFDIGRDGLGRIESITHTDGAVYGFEYTGDHVTAIVLPDGGRFTYTYSPGGDLLTVTSPNGETISYGYDDRHRMTEIWDALGNRVLLNEYDDENRVIRQTDASGKISTFSYPAPDVGAFQDEFGECVTHTYDSDLRVIRIEDARGGVTTFAYDEDYNRTRKVDSMGGVWRWDYDGHARVISSTNPLGATWLYAYDARGNRIAERNPLGAVKLYEYDGYDNLIREVDAEGNETLREYDSRGQMIREIDPLGAVTEFEYGELGLTVAITDSLGCSRMTYDARGNRTSYTDALGRTTYSTFDDADRMTSTVGPLGQVITFTHDANGNLIAESDGMGHVRTFGYDEQDRLVTRTDWMGNVWSLSYDELDRLVREENPLGGTIAYTYDAVGNVVAWRNERGGVWQYAYDLNGNKIVEIDPLGNEVRYDYDAAGQPVAINRPCSTCFGGRSVERITYDLAGREIARTDGRGYTTQYRYDRVGRLIEEIDALGQSTHYVYNGRGDLIRIIDPLGNVTQRDYNPAGWLIREVDRLGRETRYSYDAVGNLIGVRDARGYVTRYRYDAADRVIQERDALNNVTSYTYDVRGNLLSETDALGHTTTYTYDANGNIIQIVNARGYTTTYEYNALNQVLRQVDALGGVTTYAYNAAGDLIAETDPGGYTRRLTYDALGRRTSETDRNGNRTTYGYDAAGNLARVLDAAGGVTTFAFDANDNKITQLDPLGGLTTYGYDALNRQVQVIDPLGAVSTREFDPLGYLVREVNANGHATRYVRDVEGQPLLVIDALNHATRYEYDAMGNPVRVTDRNGHTTTYGYDPLGRQVSVVDALGHTQTTQYDALGNVIERRNYRGYRTTYEYDENGNLVHRIDALGGERFYRYDALDRRTVYTDANGHTTTYTYDAVGNLSTVTLPEGQMSTYAYDGEGNLIASTNASGETTTYAYDPLGRQIRETDPLGYVSRTEYDALGRVIRTIDAEGHATRFTYDPLGRLLSAIDALGHTTLYTYDAVGNMLTETDANGHTTTYVYDPLNRLIQETGPLGATWTYAYDAEGNLIQQVDANGRVIDYEFDALDRMTAIHYADSGRDVSFDYDPNGNRTRMEDGIGTTTWDYDCLDRLIRQVDPFGRTIEWSYDAVGNRLSLTYPGGDAVTYGYNANDWLVEMIEPSGGVTTYQYDPDGLPTRTDFPNGTWTAQDHDAAGRLVRKVNGTTRGTGVVRSYDYTLDGVGNRVRTVEQYADAQTRTIVRTYLYNERYELVRAVEVYEGQEDVTTHYTYDPVGNRLSMTTNRDNRALPEVTHYAYDAANHLISAGDVTYTYDPNGNRLTRETPERIETYTYDAENRLVRYASVESGQVTQQVQNRYDGLGRRLAKGAWETAGATAWTEYALDGLGYDQMAEFSPGDTSADVHLYRGPGNGLAGMGQAQTGGGRRAYWFATDGLGSVAATTGAAGESMGAHFYGPYGQLIDETGALDDTGDRPEPGADYLLSGKEWDEESGLYYFGARFYDPDAGVWLTPDPYRGAANSPMTRHSYLYARNNPVNRVDPLGLFDFQTGAVEWGDTWASIASQWDTSVATLKRLNPWVGTPKVGDRLQLPECRSAQCQMQMGITEVRIGGLSGTACAQRLVQRQRAYNAWVIEQRRLAELRRQAELNRIMAFLQTMQELKSALKDFASDLSYFLTRYMLSGKWARKSDDGNNSDEPNWFMKQVAAVDQWAWKNIPSTITFSGAGMNLAGEGFADFLGLEVEGEVAYAFNWRTLQFATIPSYAVSGEVGAGADIGVSTAYNLNFYYGASSLDVFEGGDWQGGFGGDIGAGGRLGASVNASCQTASDGWNVYVDPVSKMTVCGYGASLEGGGGGGADAAFSISTPSANNSTVLYESPAIFGEGKGLWVNPDYREDIVDETYPNFLCDYFGICPAYD
jgi:RHS repeat-associated protein